MRQGRRWLRRTGWGVVVTAIGAMSAGAESSLAASGWVAPLDIALVGAASASRPQIVLDAKGNAIAVWRRGGAVGTDMSVQSAVRPAGGPWQAPADISRPGPDEGPPALERPGPQLAIDAQGNAVAVWQRYNGTSLVVQAAERPAGGAWRAPVDISGISASGGDSRNPRVVVDPSGTALAVWVRRNPLTGGYQLQSAERPAGGTWQAPIGASSVDEASALPLDVAIDARGTALAVWVRNTGGVPQPRVVSTAHPAGGAWLAPELIPDPALLPYDVDVAVDPAGNAVASWSDFSAVAKAALRPATGGWGAAIPLGSSGHDATVGMDSAGTATVVFAEGLDEIRAVSHPAGGGWLPEARINPGGRGASSPALVVDAHGDATAAWTDATGPRPSIMVGRRAGGSWQPPIRLTADERSPAEPDVAVDPAGNAVAAWSDTTAGVISAAGFDATSPELRAVGVPASGAAGRSVSFSATPFDIWSATLATTWTFGDGAAATGNLVAHSLQGGGHTHRRRLDEGSRRKLHRHDQDDPHPPIRAGPARDAERLPAQATGRCWIQARRGGQGAFRPRARARRPPRGVALRRGDPHEPSTRGVHALRAGRIVLALTPERQDEVQTARVRRPSLGGGSLPVVRDPSSRWSEWEAVTDRLAHHRLIRPSYNRAGLPRG